MVINTPCVVSLVWRLEDTQGSLLDELTDAVEFFYGGDDLLPKVEEALAGQDVGFTTQLHLEPEHAFGDYRPELVCFEARNLFPEVLDVGLAFEGLPPGSVTPDMPADAVYLVTEIYPAQVVLDGNHPLAGMALRLAVKVIDIRAASAQEIEAGSLGSGVLTVLSSSPSLASVDKSALH